MNPLHALIAALVIVVLVLGFFAFHVLMRLYVWPETYRKKGEGGRGHPHREGKMQGGGTSGAKESAEKVQKKFKPPRTETRD